MLLKIIFSKEDNAFEIFEINNFYTECNNYIECSFGKDADLNGELREIVLNNNKIEINNIDSDFDQLIITSDTGLELLNIETEV